MRPDRERDFEQYINQLVHLLEKIAKKLPQDGKFALPFSVSKDQDLNVNVFFINFLPISPEELDEIDGFLDDRFPEEETPGDFSTKLDPADIEFLKKNGIDF